MLCNLTLADARGWLLGTLFILGNIILPQICHLIPDGGLMLLPIYFFTLIAAYRYGWQVGLLTAILSPLANSLLFGMPVPAMLPIIMIKSTLLAVVAATVARRAGAVTLLALVITVLGYQLLGGAIESALTGSLAAGIQDITIGLPGIILQIFGGYLLLRRL